MKFFGFLLIGSFAFNVSAQTDSESGPKIWSCNLPAEPYQQIAWRQDLPIAKGAWMGELIDGSVVEIPYRPGKFSLSFIMDETHLPEAKRKLRTDFIVQFWGDKYRVDKIGFYEYRGHFIPDSVHYDIDAECSTENMD